MDTQTMAIALSTLAFVAVFVLFYALTMPKHPNKAPRQVDASKTPTRFPTLQAKLDDAQIEIKADAYVTMSLKSGIPLALGLLVLVGSVTLIPIGILAGFLFTWSKLEGERDVKMIKYFKQLASACDIITNAYAVRPSMVRALQSASEFSVSPLRDDFQEMIIALRQGEFEEAIQVLSDRRKSIVFDTVANALMRAKDESGQVKDIMEKLAISTRQNVGAFEEAVSMQINARSSIRWGTYGPWMIFAVFRGVTMFLSFSSGTNAFAAANNFFSTLGGNLLSLVAAAISMGLYVYGFRLAQRGLVVKRIQSANDIPAKVAQKPGAGDKGEGSKRPGRWSRDTDKGPVQIPVTPKSA